MRGSIGCVGVRAGAPAAAALGSALLVAWESLFPPFPIML
jgi:hypothetical protein